MFRYSTFEKLTAQSVVLVNNEGREIKLTQTSASLLYATNLAGFYFTFSSKCHPNARAYYTKLDHLTEPWKTLCPVYILRQLHKNRLLFTGKIFNRKKITSRSLGSYMAFVARTTSPFTPHSLRIGGHTFLAVQNMHEDFIQFLGRRVISRASQLYYRANAIDNILRLKMFFGSLSNLPALYSHGLFAKN